MTAPIIDEINTMSNASYYSQSQQLKLVAKVRTKQLTDEMEMVARAKGSPIMFPMRMPLRPPYWPLEFSIFLNDGECSEP